MSRTYSLVEPHPTAAPSGYLGSGRGGAGNFSKYKCTELTDGSTASGPASRTALFSSSLTSTLSTAKPSRMKPGGRGGAGNFRPAAPRQSEEAIFQFDEEMVKRRDSAAPIVRIGRGGMGNWTEGEGAVAGVGRTERLGSTDSRSSADSQMSATSSVRRVGDAWGRLSKRLSRE